MVRRDLTGFQHVHPALAADGTWSDPARRRRPPGSTGCSPTSSPPAATEALTLGVDVPAAGDYQPGRCRQPRRTATVDGYTVTLDGDLVPGTVVEADPDGQPRTAQPVTDLQPYLGAYGHLVALRDGDLAYLHVHPDGEPGDGRTAAGPDDRLLRRGARPPAPTGCSWTSSTPARSAPPSSPPSPPRRRRTRARPRRRTPTSTATTPPTDEATMARPPPSARIELAIGGMTCASCATRIEKKLNRIDGVTATVNYATEKATVTFADPASPPTT